MQPTHCFNVLRLVEYCSLITTWFLPGFPRTGRGTGYEIFEVLLIARVKIKSLQNYNCTQIFYFGLSWITVSVLLCSRNGKFDQKFHKKSSFCVCSRRSDWVMLNRNIDNCIHLCSGCNLCLATHLQDIMSWEASSALCVIRWIRQGDQVHGVRQFIINHSEIETCERYQNNVTPH